MCNINDKIYDQLVDILDIPKNKVKNVRYIYIYNVESKNRMDMHMKILVNQLVIILKVNSDS